MSTATHPTHDAPRADDLAGQDHRFIWHPFTPMRQWRSHPPLMIERGEGPYLVDTEGNRYIDGVSSLWCNVHGHRVPRIDHAIREQLDRIAHTTLLGLSSPPSIRLAAKLAPLLPGADGSRPGPLTRFFYSDAGATAVEAALKMAVGYWFHNGRPKKNRFIALGGAYHGDTTGSMAVGFSDLFHRPFSSMVFKTVYTPAPDACRPPEHIAGAHDWAATYDAGLWPSEDPALSDALTEYCLGHLDQTLNESADHTAAVIVEPVMQGAAGMICQPPGFLRAVAELARRHDVLLIADEVATGFGRTGAMFACEHDGVTPDIICLAKGLSAGYLPLALTVATDRIALAFEGEPHERRTFYHGHTYTGNPLGCAAAIASLDLFEQTDLVAHTQQSATIIHERLAPLRRCLHVLDVRQRGLMTGIELCRDRAQREPFDFAKQTAANLCLQLRSKGLIIRPLGDVIVLMPIPAMDHETLHRMLDIVVPSILQADLS